MKNIIVLVFIIFIYGCATEEKYRNILNTNIGLTELELIRKLGPPVNSYEVGGSKFIVYSSSRNVVIPGSQPTYTTTVVGNTAYTNKYGGTEDANIPMSCATTYEIQNGKVATYSYKGNDCKSF